MASERLILASRPAWISRGVLGAVGGVLLGLVAAAMATVLSAPYVLLAFAALAIVLPTLLFRDFTLYWLWGYLFFLPFEASKRISNLGEDPETIINTLGLPPSTYLGIKLFPTDFVLLPLLVVWAFAMKRKKMSFHFPRVGWLLVAYLIWATISSLVKAEHPSLALAQLVQEYKFLAVFLLFVSLLSSVRMIRFVTGVLVLTIAMEVSVALGLFAAGHTRDSLAESLNVGVEHEYEFLRGQEKGLRAGEADPDLRASGTFGAASHLSMYLALLFPLPLALAASAKRPGWRIFFLALFLFASATLYLTLSRAGLLGLVAGAGVCVLLLRFRGYLGTRLFLPVAFVAVAFAAVQVPVFYAHMSARPYTFWHRFNLFREGTRIVVDNPILGVGANNSTAARLRYAERQPYQSRSTAALVAFDNLYPIHNQYVVVAAETGLIGLFLSGGFFVALTAAGIRLSRSKDALLAAVAIAAVSGFVALGTQLLGDHFVGNAQHTVVAIYCAVIVAIGRIANAPSVEARPHES